jgi:2-polyprenyl-3-methyl-5-hydroxy-6-metoxy-1,4-benzoquinol methylase
MPDFSIRSRGVEIMDDLACQGDVVNQTLRELDIINHWLGGNAVTLQAIQSAWESIPKTQTITIADLGCGSGEMLRILARLAEKEKRKVVLIGYDANPNIIDYAINHSKEFNHITFQSTNVFSREFQDQKFDFVLATLFMHHFAEEELVPLFSSLKNQVKEAVIINDIHRHPLAYHSIKLLTSLFSRSEMVRFDAPLSVVRAFTKPELQRILAKSKIAKYSLTWKWAFRWQLIIPTQSV